MYVKIFGTLQLDEAEEALIEEHIDGCAACRERLDRLLTFPPATESHEGLDLVARAVRFELF